MFANLLDAQLF